MPISSLARRRPARAAANSTRMGPLPNDENDREGEKGSHGDVEQPEAAAAAEGALGGGPEGEPQKTAGQRGQREQGSKARRLQDGTPGVGAQKGPGRARAHEPGFRVDPLKGRGGNVADRVPVRRGIDVAGGRRDL